MNLRHLSLLALMALLMGLATVSCSRQGELLDTVPADVSAVATVDFKKLCEASGITFTSEGIKADDKINGGVRGDLREMLDRMARLDSEGVADFSRVAVAVAGDGAQYVTFAISDYGKLKEQAGEWLEWQPDADGYHVADVGDGCTFLCSSSQAWLVNDVRGSATKALEGLLKRAGEMPVTKLDGVMQALSRENIANIAVASGFITFATDKKSDTEIPAQDKEWNVASLNTGADNSLVAEWETMQSTGRTVKVKGMQNINPALLAYVPEDYSVTFAAGLTPEFNWKPLEQLALAVGGFQAGAFMAVVNPFLESINGSVLIAAKPLSEYALAEGDPSDWDFIVMAHMPQDKINSLMTMIATMMSTAGIAPSVNEDGMMVVPQYGKNLYIGNVDGYLGISTKEFDNSRNNSLAPTFVNKDMAFATAFPMDGGVTIDASVSMTSGKGQAKFKVNGTDSPTLMYLLSILLSKS